MSRETDSPPVSTKTNHSESPSDSSKSHSPCRHRRRGIKLILHWVRRGHLYLGLFLLPWAFLYALTAFLFNHPTVFSDRPTVSFGAEEIKGTPLESTSSPQDLANQVLAELNQRAEVGQSYRLSKPEEIRFTRSFAVASVKTEDQQISVLVDLVGKSGRIRSAPRKSDAPKEKAPFAIGIPSRSGRGRAGGRSPESRPKPTRSSNLLKFEDPLNERIEKSVPTILARKGFPTGEVTLTSMPDLSFSVVDQQGREWKARYSITQGTVSGDKPDQEPETISTRRFLTRLHLAHGYPSSGGVRWFWAIIVDVMAGVLFFWGVSGLLMWWQIKATRKAGLLVMLLSVSSAGALGYGMYLMLNT